MFAPARKRMGNIDEIGLTWNDQMRKCDENAAKLRFFRN